MADTDKPLEKEVQKDILSTLAAYGFVGVHVPNGAVLAGDERRRSMQMNALKRAGVKPGFPDLIVLGPPGKVGFIEVKREGGKLSHDQEHWRDCLALKQVPYAVCRSIQDTIDTLREWGWIA